MDETLELGGNAVAVDDGTPLQEAVENQEFSTHLGGGNLLMISSRDPNVRVRIAQHQCEHMALPQGSTHADSRTGRHPRATIQRMKSSETATTLFESPPT